MLTLRIRDANLAKRGIDGNDMNQQVKVIEERGKELLKEYIEKKGDDLHKMIPRQEADEILGPLSGAFKIMETAMNMKGWILNDYYVI